MQIDVDPEDPLKLPSAYADNYKDGDLFKLEFRGAEGLIYKIYLSINEVECAKPTEAETSAGAGTKPVTEVGTGTGTQASAKSATAGNTEVGVEKLPTTGANTAGLMLAAGLLLVAGGTLVGIRRRWNN